METTSATEAPKTQRSFARFAFLSAISFTLNLLLTVVFHEVLGIPDRFAYLPTIVILMVFNFFALRKFVYPDATGKISQQFLGFVLSIAAFRVLEYASYFVCVHVLQIDYRVTILIVAPSFAAGKYGWLKVSVFKSNQAANVG